MNFRLSELPHLLGDVNENVLMAFLFRRDETVSLGATEFLDCPWHHRISHGTIRAEKGNLICMRNLTFVVQFRWKKKVCKNHQKYADSLDERAQEQVSRRTNICFSFLCVWRQNEMKKKTTWKTWRDYRHMKDTRYEGECERRKEKI